MNLENGVFVIGYSLLNDATGILYAQNVSLNGIYLSWFNLDVAFGDNDRQSNPTIVSLSDG